MRSQRIFPLLLAWSFLWLVAVVPAVAGEQCWEIPVHRCQSDVEAKEAHDTCAMHKPSAGSQQNAFWPEPCSAVDKHYSESGAKAKFDAIERIELQNELEQVKGVIGK